MQMYANFYLFLVRVDKKSASYDIYLFFETVLLETSVQRHLNKYTFTLLSGNIAVTPCG